MDIQVWWPLLDVKTRDWLVEHNGEPLPPKVATAMMAVSGGTTDSSSWAKGSTDDTQLSDEAVDWIEGAANDEGPTAS